MCGFPIDSRDTPAVSVAAEDGSVLARSMSRRGLRGVLASMPFRSIPVLIALAAAAVSASGERIESFSPQGFSKDVRQVAVRFSAAMVALGDPGRAAPFVVDCPVAGTGRWIDERHWVYDFEYDVPGAVMCRFKLREGVRTFAGEPLETKEYTFHTGGPSILDHRPRSWRKRDAAVVDERQVFLLALDAVADLASIRRHARCRLVGQPDDIPVDVLDGEARAEVLRALEEASPMTLSRLVRSVRMHLPRDADDAFERVVLLKCRDELPGGGELRLVWGAGISGAGGSANVDDQVLEFVVRPRFRIEVDCSASFEGKCLGSVSARFTTPVDRSLAERVRVVDERGVALAREVDEDLQVHRVRFPAPLVENASYRVELTGPIEDIDGRPLANAADFPVTIETGRMPPGATFGTGLRVIAAGESALAPLLLRRPPERLNGYRLRVTRERDIARWLDRVWKATRDWSGEDVWPNPQAAIHSILANQRGVRRFTLTPDQTDAPFRSAGVAIGEPGLHVLELPLPESTAPTERRFVLGTVMATNLAIDFQHGYESSLVWVTTLDHATPVANAEVRLSHGCARRPLWRGRTDVNGLARIDGPLPWGSRECRGPRLLSVRKHGDLSILGVGGSWWYGRNQSGPTSFHTIFDRSLYQPGETVSMKHVLRIPTSAGFKLPPGLPVRTDLTIEHWGSGERYRQTVELDADGSAVNALDLPPEARLGWYRVEFDVDDYLHHRTGFRVERFRTGTMRAAISGPADALANPESVPLVVSAWHLAGGPVAYQPVVLQIAISGDHPYQRRYWEDLHWEDDSGYREPVVRTEHLTLDGDGEARFEVRELPSFTYGGTLSVAMTYPDANGQFRTESNRFHLAPANVQLWVPRDDRAAGRFRILARRLDRSAAPGIGVDAELLSYSHHEVEVRLPGGFRARRRDSTSRLEAECAGRTDSAGALTCEIPPHLQGEGFLVRATASDEHGNVERLATFVSGPRARPFVQVDSEEAFSPGSAVSLDVDLPFAAATALVAVHREGVLDAYVTGLGEANAVATLPIAPNYAPNVRVSVLARNQLGGPDSAQAPQIVQTGANATLVPKPDGPTWQRGAVNVPVEWTANALDVRVAADRETYKPQERVRVQIAVLGPDGTPRPDAEVTVAAVDEGLLDLRPNRSWDILDAMMRRRSSLVSTSGSLDLIDRPLTLWGDRERDGNPVAVAMGPSFDGNRVDDSDVEGPIGRRHLDSLLLWQARVAVDSEGLAEVEVPLNDLLTSIRIVAVATAGTGLFGTGHVVVRTSQDLILNAGLPDVVRQGDRFGGVFTVRNASETTRRIDVTGRIEGYLELPNRTVTLAPGESREIVWPVTAPADREQLDWDVTARSETAADRLLARQSVRPTVPVRVQQATLTQVTAPVELPVVAPRGALPGQGGVAVSLRSSLAGGLGEMRAYMAEYPYTCVEQLVSVAVALDDPSRWSRAMATAGRSIDEAGLLRYFPVESIPGSPVLTAYVLTIADAAGKVIPQNLRSAMVRGLRDHALALVQQPGAPSPRRDLVALNAMAALARHGGVRRRMMDGIDPNVELLPTSALIDWIDILRRVAPAHEDLPRANRALRSRLNLQGTTLGFSTESRDRLVSFMVSGDDNAARAILSMLDDPEWRADLPRMMRGLHGRQQRGRWRTTVANAWGAVAVSRFGAEFEARSVTGTTVVRNGEIEERASWPLATGQAVPQGFTELEPIEIPWGLGKTVSIDHEGTGAPWGLVTLRAAVPLHQGVSRGYRLARTVEPVGRSNDDVWRRGDVARVSIEVAADADMNWVVVDDPLPPGAVVLGSGLQGQSTMAARGFVSGGLWPAFVERGLDSYRAYYERVPKGTFRLAYQVRYNTSGEFHLPPARVEAMYAPEMHAEWPVEPVVIR